MAYKKLLDKYNGITEWLVEDESEKKWYIHRQADVEDVVDANKRFQNSGYSGYTPDGSFKHVARVHPHQLDVWGQQRGLPYQWYLQQRYEDELTNFLNDPDNKYWRTGGGVI